jgi:hypothetical protein
MTHTLFVPSNPAAYFSCALSMVFKASLKRRLSVALASERPPAALKKGPL